MNNNSTSAELERIKPQQGDWPSVSVVIPAHNAGATIAATLQSVLNQTVPVQEIWVIDNNSRADDQTLAVIQALDAPQIHYVDAKPCANGNVARNWGSALAKGQWIAYCDSDDEWLPQHIESRLTWVNEQPWVQAVFSAAFIRNGEQLNKSNSRAIDADENPVEFLVGRHKSLAQTSSYFIRHHVWQQCRWDESLARHQDYEFFILVQQQVGWHFLPEATYVINWHGDQARHHHFESYWQFYQKYQSQLSSPSLATYLFTRWREASLFASDRTYVNKFAQELSPHQQHLSWAKRILFRVPFLLPLIWPLIRHHV